MTIKCTCGATMNKPVKRPSGLLEFKCPVCRRTVLRSNETNPTQAGNKHAGKKVLRWT